MSAAVVKPREESPAELVRELAALEAELRELVDAMQPLAMSPSAVERLLTGRRYLSTALLFLQSARN